MTSLVNIVIYKKYHKNTKLLKIVGFYRVPIYIEGTHYRGFYAIAF